MDTKDISFTKGITLSVISGAYCTQDHKRHTYMDTILEINASGADCCIPIYMICVYIHMITNVYCYISKGLYI